MLSSSSSSSSISTSTSSSLIPLPSSESSSQHPIDSRDSLVHEELKVSPPSSVSREAEATQATGRNRMTLRRRMTVKTVSKVTTPQLRPNVTIDDGKELPRGDSIESGPLGDITQSNDMVSAQLDVHNPPMSRLVGVHVPAIVPAVIMVDDKRHRHNSVCVVCYHYRGLNHDKKKRLSRIRTKCRECRVFLCMQPAGVSCWEVWHTKRDMASAFQEENSTLASHENQENTSSGHGL